MTFGVAQGSILGALLFNIYFFDRFYDITGCDITKYADDSTPYFSSFSLDKVINKLEACINKFLRGFTKTT